MSILPITHTAVGRSEDMTSRFCRALTTLTSGLARWNSQPKNYRKNSKFTSSLRKTSTSPKGVKPTWRTMHAGRFSILRLGLFWLTLWLVGRPVTSLAFPPAIQHVLAASTRLQLHPISTALSTMRAHAPLLAAS